MSIEYVAPATKSGSSSPEGAKELLTGGRERDHGMAVVERRDSVGALVRRDARRDEEDFLEAAQVSSYTDLPCATVPRPSRRPLPSGRTSMSHSLTSSELHDDRSHRHALGTPGNRRQ